MGKRKELPVDPPGRTPEARENQMIALAMDEAEKRLRDGTASSQILTHYLKLATVKERKELEILEAKKRLYNAKAEAYDASKKSEELYEKVLEAMKIYSGVDDDFYDE